MVPMMFLQPRRLSPGFRAPPTQPLHLELSLEKKRQLKLNPSNVKPSWRELLGFHAHSWGRRNYLPGGTLLCRDLTLSLLEGRVCLSRGGGGICVTWPFLTLLGTWVPLLRQLLFLPQLVSESRLTRNKDPTGKAEGQ